MLYRILSLTALTALSAYVIVGAAPPAHACGGFFCNAQTQTPVYQAGERVLFAQYDELVTMHIEVIYGGDDPTKFAWILPVPDVPKGTDGQPLPLDKAVSVSLPELFDRLQTATNPSFTVTRTADPSFDACLDFDSNAGGFNTGTVDVSADASAGMDSGAQGGPPPVAVLDEAQVGPYDAQLIDAESSDALFDWLNDNGYYQDPASKPLLGYYVSLGYKFIGIRLQADKATADLKPLAIRLGENAPCVPLRLTSIAATADMPILVWVAGNGRAIPKNFIHAVVNPMAINHPSASNYIDVVTEAIELAVGRAWVTEFAGSTEQFRGMFSVTPKAIADTANATTLNGLFDKIFFEFTVYSHFQDILQDEIPMPEGLRGYPFGDCWYGGGGGFGGGFDGGGEGSGNGCDADAEHVTTEAEFYNYLYWWVTNSSTASAIAATDLEQLKNRIKAEIIESVEGIDEIFTKTTTLTRFFTTIDPEDMTKDPMFAFNPDLPDVDPAHVTNTVVYGSNAECGPGVVVATYDDGSSYSWKCEGLACWNQALTVSAVEGASVLKNLQVLDETGTPVSFDPDQAEEVDAILDTAVIGQPTLSDAAMNSLDPPPPVNLPPGATPPGVGVPQPMLGDGDSVSGVDGCAVGGPSLGFITLLALGLALVLVRRREEEV